MVISKPGYKTKNQEASNVGLRYEIEEIINIYKKQF